MNAKKGKEGNFSLRHDFSLLSADDLHFFNEGTHLRLYEKLGAHPVTVDGIKGTFFAVWAPNAYSVSVIGDFNGWNPGTHPLQAKAQSGIWEGFISGIGPGTRYKFHIDSRFHGYKVDKADPLGFLAEPPPQTASIVTAFDYAWGDSAWMEQRQAKNGLSAPISIYEVHLGSFLRATDERWRALGYRELAPRLAEYVAELGFTHIEFLPVMEHPFFASWGYQTTGYYSPTCRFGPPQDFMFLVDTLHRNGIGVILDWVPSHFPTDEHGLGFFDGTHLYEHADPRKGFHPDWKSFIFNYGRNEVRSFLLSNALFWLDRYHVDGLRVDAVASMLYLDYSRKDGEWLPNQYGGKENLEALSFLRQFNQEVFGAYPDVQTIAEESTAWPMVSRPTYIGGLGFGMKWDMGWMHDTLRYMSKDPIYRKFQHNDLTFRMLYSFNENFVLPLSHDEVVHGKSSLLYKMPGDEWQKFANLRLLFGNMFGQPGKKLIFMGGEFGQSREWNHDDSLDWQLLQFPLHQGVRRWVADLNRVYRSEPSLFELEFTHEGFQWVDCHDTDHSAVSFLRFGKTTDDAVLWVFNYTPVPRHDYRVGVPGEGFWEERLNSDASIYGGSGIGNLGGLAAEAIPSHGLPFSLTLNLPPLAVVVLKGKRPAPPPKEEESAAPSGFPDFSKPEGSEPK